MNPFEFKMLNVATFATLIIPFSAFGTNFQNAHYFVKLVRANFLLCDTKFMNTSSFSVHFKTISAGSKVFIECIMCFAKVEEFYILFSIYKYITLYFILFLLLLLLHWRCSFETFPQAK